MASVIVTRRAWPALLVFVVGCGNTSVAGPAVLVILQNQQGVLDGGTVCVGSPDFEARREQGVLDVGLDKPYPYIAYPLVWNRGLQVALVEGSKVVAKPPEIAGHVWDSGCPLRFESPFSIVLDSGAERPITVEAMPRCLGAQLASAYDRKLLATGAELFVEIELRAVGRMGSSPVASEPFNYSVRVCYGCLQQEFPLVPPCSKVPPETSPGNPCNIAQDGPTVLCCLDNEDVSLRCPSRDQV